MLEIEIPKTEAYNEETNEFVSVNKTTLKLEHSLISISKWESKWHKPFLSDKQIGTEEALDYIRCMTLNPVQDDNVYRVIPNDCVEKISKYIEDPMTATWFNDKNRPRNKEVITSELIYYWMVAFNIPFECEKWHLNRLLTLVHICSIKNSKQSKMPKKDIMSQNRALNEARRARSGSRG